MTPATILEYNSVRQSITEWALDYGITPAIIIARLERSMTAGDAITTPMKVGHAGQRLPIFSPKQRPSARKRSCGTPARTYAHNGQTLTIAEWSRVTGLRECTIGSRLRKGWPMELVFGPNQRGRVRQLSENVIRPGVVSNLSAFEGTGAGSTSQETPNITFSGNEA